MMVSLTTWISKTVGRLGGPYQLIVDYFWLIPAELLSGDTDLGLLWYGITDLGTFNSLLHLYMWPDNSSNLSTWSIAELDFIWRWHIRDLYCRNIRGTWPKSCHEKSKHEWVSISEYNILLFGLSTDSSFHYMVVLQVTRGEPVQSPHDLLVLPCFISRLMMLPFDFYSHRNYIVQISLSDTRCLASCNNKPPA